MVVRMCSLMSYSQIFRLCLIPLNFTSALVENDHEKVIFDFWLRKYLHAPPLMALRIIHQVNFVFLSQLTGYYTWPLLRVQAPLSLPGTMSK